MTMIPSVAEFGTINSEPTGLPPGVLVVDDDSTLRTILARELRKRGFTVWVAAGGGEALRLYVRHAELIDIVLMDVNMPGVSGPEAHAAIRAGAPHVRCCFMTADPRPGLRESLLAGGALAVFCKPFASLAELCEALRRHAGEACRTTEEADQWTS
jgi:CheY-like chemotaxis protein